MGEDQRQRAAFHALEQLLEPEPRTVQQVLRAARPLSGEEFERVTALIRVVISSITVSNINWNLDVFMTSLTCVFAYAVAGDRGTSADWRVRQPNVHA